MSALESLFLEIEKHAIMRGHAKLIQEANAEIEKLKEDSHKLECLQCYGVDNWQGYDDAMQYYNKNFGKDSQK